MPSFTAPALKRDLPGIALVTISRLQTLCENMLPRYSDKVRFLPLRQGFHAAVAALQASIDAGAVDVVLAAGSNGAYLRDHLSVPVVTVKVNGFDVLDAIREAAAARPGARIGLVMHGGIAQELDALGAWLNIELRQRSYDSINDVDRVVRALAAGGCTVIIGPGMACDVAQQIGLDHIFLYSQGAVEEALQRCVELALLSRQKETKRIRMNTIMAHLRDGVAAFDEAGQLEAANPVLFELLGIAPEQQAAARVARLAAPFLREAASGGAIENRVIDVDGRALVLSCVPMVEQQMRAGAVLTLQDPLVAQQIERTLRTAQRPRHLIARHRLRDLVGACAALEQVRRLAASAARHEATVLLTGESGTGKEVVAQGIHNAGRRRDHPFVAFNCAAVPEGLIESELFGHDDGAFTGARRGGKAGLFEMAHGGTIFLDEIGEMPMALQSRLLRVLQEREVMRLGSGRPVPVDVRVIAATHRDLKQLVATGHFRADVYYRLNLLQIRLPPLRERRGDLPQLAAHLLEKIVAQYGLPAAPAADILRQLQPLFLHYGWPGNVRELENLLTRAAIHLNDAPDGAADGLTGLFPELDAWRDAAPSAAAPHGPARQPEAAPLSRADIMAAIDACKGNRAADAEAAAGGRTTLWRLLKEADA